MFLVWTVDGSFYVILQIQRKCVLCDAQRPLSQHLLAIDSTSQSLTSSQCVNMSISATNCPLSSTPHKASIDFDYVLQTIESLPQLPQY